MFRDSLDLAKLLIVIFKINVFNVDYSLSIIQIESFVYKLINDGQLKAAHPLFR